MLQIISPFIHLLRLFSIKSVRDVQQIDHFCRQLNKSEFLRDFCQKATMSSYGDFFLDLDAKKKLFPCGSVPISSDQVQQFFIYLLLRKWLP